MAYKIRDFTSEKDTSCCSSSVNEEALIVASMCIVGLPVDVHVKDGSVYSGIFHTASVDDPYYGVVLKKAKMTRKGKVKTNVPHGHVVETLVIFTGDLVQVVAKGAVLDANDISGNLPGDDLGNALSIGSSDSQMNETEKSMKFAMDRKKTNKTRSSAQNRNGSRHGFIPTIARNDYEQKMQPPSHLGSAAELGNGRGDKTNFKKHEALPIASVSERMRAEYNAQKTENESSTEAGEVQVPNPSIDALSNQERLAEHGHMETSRLATDVLSSDSAQQHTQSGEVSTSVNTSKDSVSERVSSSCSPVTDSAPVSSSRSSEVPAIMAPQQNSEPKKVAKEFKLNPDAKIFAPSNAKSTSTTPPTVPSVARMAYVPNAPTAATVAGAHSEVGSSPFTARSPLPVKFVPYNNLMTGNGATASPFPEPIIGQPVTRTQPMRYAGQCNPVQAGPMYMHPNSQAVMVGRLGQLVYVNQYSQELVHGTAAVSPVSARPLVTPQVQFPKHQGTVAGQPLPLGMSSPFVTGGQQPFQVPGQFPFLQPPFPANHPIPVPPSNVLFGTKLP